MRPGGLALDWRQEVGIQAVAKHLGLTWDAVDGIMQRSVRRVMARCNPVVPTALAVDEKAYKKRRNYRIVVSDGVRPLHVAGEWLEDRQDRIHERAGDIEEEIKMLREIRSAFSRSQAEVAQELGVGQAQVSKIESRGGSLQIGTLRKYLSSMGLDMEIRAKDQNGHEFTIGLEGLEDGDEATV